MYKNNWVNILNEEKDAFCLNVGLASVAAKYKDSKKFAERVCYAHDVMQKIESVVLDGKFDTTVVKFNWHLFDRLFKKLMNK